MSRTALVTGGSSGIGRATAARLVDDGWQVVVTGRDAGRLEAAVADLPADRVLALTGDAGDDAAVSRWVAATVDRFGGLDAAVANAGFATAGWPEEHDPTAWRDMVLTNCLGPALLIHHARRHLLDTHGRVVLVGSVAGLVPTPGNLYGATKYAVTALAENARRALTGDGVGVTLIAPGRVETGFWDVLGSHPDAPMLHPDDVAGSIAWVLAQPGHVDVNTVTVRPFVSPV